MRVIKNPPPPDLGPHSSAQDVANLQEALRLLIDRGLIRHPDPPFHEQLVAILHDEIGQTIYGDATHQFVAVFQAGHQIPESGLVDERTAEELNRLLRELGALDSTPAAGFQRIVAGQVLYGDQTPFRGLVILYEESAGSRPLSREDTDPEGRYAVGYTLSAGTASAHLRVAAFDAEGQRRAEATIEATRPVEVVNLAVRGEGRAFRIVGRVASDRRAGVGGLRVLVVDKNVGGDLTLCETTTGVDGSYRAAFTYTGEKPQPDLQARAFHGETLLGDSAVRYNAANDETLDIVVQAAAETALATEHETLTRDLAAQFAGNLGDLQETDDRQDITYLANKTGWDARAVALASLAEQFSARSAAAADGVPIHPSLFYALFRAGLPANDTALYRAGPATVAAIWKQAIADGIVPAEIEASIAGAMGSFQTLSAREALDGPAVVGLSSLKEMLAVTLPDADATQQEEFATLLVQHQGDPAAFWGAVRATFDEPVAKRLQLDGQLGFLTLNNAPLTAKLHEAAAQAPLTDPVNLIEQGYYRPDKWLALLGNIPIPPEIAGAEEPERQANYADVLATQLRLSYPTAAVAAMVKSGDTPTLDGMAERVHGFLMEHRQTFEIGMQPVEQFVGRHAIQLEPEVQHEITRIQRVRQITPSDAAMNALLRHGVDSALAVARYERDEFVKAFKDEVGGEADAALIHAKAQQVHNAVLNIATSYVLASNAPGLGVHSPAQILAPAPRVPAEAGDVIAYPTLQKLFGEMDYCTCEHCRSILSPAAYLVDLLQFLDREEPRWQQFLSQWPQDHGSAPYPFGSKDAWDNAGQPAAIAATPLEVLLSRRPDLQHLPLTCENTNTPLPYIDLVNEVLEHFVANGLDLENYTGHSTDGSATPEELMANPQFVQELAYDILSGKAQPAPLPPTPLLPFHRQLERLRRTFDALAAPLPRVMEALRRTEALERPSEDDYGWRDIWMEELGLSRAEYARLSNRALTLQQLYGFVPATSEAEAVAALSNAKAFARRLDISYEDLIELLRTRFVNPNGALIPRLERLGVRLDELKAFKDGAMSAQEFDEALAPGLDAAQYGGDIKAWVKDQENYDRIMSLVVLADSSGTSGVCSFDQLEFRYADPARLAEHVRPFEFIRLLRFIRLWKKLGWSIEQTDKAITALWPADQLPDDPDDGVNLQRLDAGFLVLLPRLSVLLRVIDSLNLKLKTDLLPLLACFAPLDTYGASSLYRKLFLNPGLLALDPAFGDDGYGNVLDGSQKLLDHEEALRAALSLTDDEFRRIGENLGADANTLLKIDIVSAIFRRGWLARQLKLSVQEFLLITQFSDLDPFAPIEPARPSILRLITLVNRLRSAGLKPSPALYLIWNQDISAKSALGAGQINEFARSLRAGFAAVEAEFATAANPDEETVRARMALAYDSATTDLFFGLLSNTLVSEVPYSHGQATLEQPILDSAPGRIAYDDLRKRLSFAGVMTATMRDALKVGVPLSFEKAVDELYDENRKIVEPFFARHPELEPLYDAYIASTDPVERKRSALLASFLPTLKQRRKRQQALQAIGAAAKADAAFAGVVLDSAAVLHAAADTKLPALDDLTAIEQAGLAAEFYYRDTATGTVDERRDTEAVLGYRRASVKNRPDHKLPDNGGNSISGIWSGYLEVPESGFYNIRIEADAGAGLELALGDAAVTLTQNGNRWSNTTALELDAGTLVAFTLKVEKVKDTLNVQWHTAGRGWEIIPARYLYSATLRDGLHATVVRFFKAASLAAALKLTVNEVAFLAAHADLQIDGQSWLNSLPVVGSPDAPTSRQLFASLDALLDLGYLKGELAPDDESLLEVLQAPEAATQKPESLLFALTRWDPAAFSTLLARLGKQHADLADVNTLRRVFDAYAWVRALGIPVAALIAATTNEPGTSTVRDLEAALRARYAESDWLNMIKPISDQLRSLQRDALVAYILHQMRADPLSAHIDTPDKLFEFFLMDVQMDPCMQTSRIRHALSSVQMFIERCLMNLERRVASAALNARWWEWMKRYRVWEANRKVFLWPENWLEPELRDDQSPFFKETMSELLQGDITEDRAAGALLNYLAKLDEVAKLEPCGIHYVENQPGAADDVAHIIARTAGANRKYYYRRREYGYWTPWEQVNLGIEDNPVIPVVWKNRLFLFWLRIIQQVSMGEQAPLHAKKDADLTKIKVSDINAEPQKVKVQAMLCWSEYYNGKWQPTKTSAVDRPTTLRTRVFSGPVVSGEFVMGMDWTHTDALFNPTEFDRSALVLQASEVGGALQIDIRGSWDQGASSFTLYNTHSLPVREEDGSRRSTFTGGPRRSLRIEDGTLLASYQHGTTRERSILTNPLGGRVVAPTHQLLNPWEAPFFYEDSRHVFYVTTFQRSVTIPSYQGYGGPTGTPSKVMPHIPSLVLQPKPRVPDPRGPVSFEQHHGIGDTAPIERFVSEDAHIRRALGTIGSVTFGDKELGPAGALTIKR